MHSIFCASVILDKKYGKDYKVRKKQKFYLIRNNSANSGKRKIELHCPFSTFAH